MKQIRICRESFKLSGKIIKKSLFLGITSFLAQASLVISLASVQTMCAKYGATDVIFSRTEYSQIPLAVLGIVMKFFNIATCVSIGLAAGCIPIVGYNIGAGRADRVKKLFSRLLVTEAVIGVVVLALVEAFPGKLVGIFGGGNESAYYTDFAIKAFRIYLCLLPAAMINKGTFIYLQAMGKPVLSSAISMTREIVFGASLPVAMPIFFGLDGILLSSPAADLLTFVPVAIIIAKIFRELNGN